MLASRLSVSPIQEPWWQTRTVAATDAGDESPARPEWQWDVALSFAGAQRDYVEQVAEALKARGLRCFYDADEQVRLWGKPLAEELPAVYGEQAAVVVIFISADYVARDWTRAERRAALAGAARQRREYVLPARFDDTPLPGLAPDVVTVNLRGRTPRQFAVMIADKLAELGIAGPGGRTDAAGPAGGAGAAARPDGAVRVRDADPRRLGVHAAISVPDVSDEVLPEYVPRDSDADPAGVRGRVAAAADRGGFVLIVGGSSVGKTRCAVEAVRALLPDWWLVHPASAAEVSALARAPVPRTVVWLDELQRYLDGEDGLGAGAVRALLNGRHPPLIIATLWPEYHAAYSAMPAGIGTDLFARQRAVLDLAAVVRIAPEFSPDELDRARAAAARDRRLKIALDSAGDQLTQTLAAAPQLVARWDDARTASPYAWAVLTAALDAARLGARAPLSAAFLRQAAPGYCSSRQRAEAPADWFGQALAYATGTLYGAAAALTPAGAGMGQVAGYTAADYLVQHATRERRAARAPASTWDAILAHVSDPADIARLAGSAASRLLYRYAIPLFRRVADTSDEQAVEFARLQIDRGDLDDAWRVLDARAAAAGDARAGAADDDVVELTSLLAELSEVRELRARADAGDTTVTEQLAERLAEYGDPDDADRSRALADAGDVEGLRTLADGGSGLAAIDLARLLADRGDLDQLRARADAGDGFAATSLADLLADRADIDQLVARADAGDGYAAGKLAAVLADRHDLGQLHARAIAGDGAAADRLADIQAHRHDLNRLRARADAGNEKAAMDLADALSYRGDLDQLRARADAGDEIAAIRLAEALAHRGDLDQLRARADAGDGYAEPVLAGVLAARGGPGDIAELHARADAGDGFAAWRLGGVLAARGDIAGLRERIDAGDPFAAERLPRVMIARGRREDGERLRRFGLNPDGSIAGT